MRRNRIYRGPSSLSYTFALTWGEQAMPVLPTGVTEGSSTNTAKHLEHNTALAQSSRLVPVVWLLNL